MKSYEIVIFPMKLHRKIALAGFRKGQTIKGGSHLSSIQDTSELKCYQQCDANLHKRAAVPCGSITMCAQTTSASPNLGHHFRFSFNDYSFISWPIYTIFAPKFEEIWSLFTWHIPGLILHLKNVSLRR